MKRVDLLRAAASLPFIGALFASPATPQLESATSTLGRFEAEAVDSEEVDHAFAGLTDAGKYVSTEMRAGWPDIRDLAVAARQGFDRVEIWSRADGAIIFQGPTVMGRIPVGWDSLVHAGFMR